MTDENFDFANQNGTLEEMLTLNPRNWRDGMVYKCKTNNKIYVCSQKSIGTKAEVIKDIRKGNFVWIELIFDKDQNTYTRGVDQLSHNTSLSYPDNQINDEYDLLVALIDNLNVNDTNQKEKYKSLFYPNTNLIDVLLSLTNDCTVSESFKSKDIKTWLQFVLGNFFESLFFKWIEN